MPSVRLGYKKTEESESFSANKAIVATVSNEVQLNARDSNDVVVCLLKVDERNLRFNGARCKFHSLGDKIASERNTET